MKSPTDENLANVAVEKYIHLTTNGRKSGKSHTVELWFAVDSHKVYLSHEGEETDWMKNIEKNKDVRFQIAGREFIGKAHLLKDQTEEAWKAKVALYEKYYGKADREVIEDWFSLSKLVAVELA